MLFNLRALLSMALFVIGSSAFTTTTPNTANKRTTSLLGQTVKATTTSSSSAAAMPGVADFETWISKFDGASIDSNVKHSLFNCSLRGLEWTGGSKQIKAPTKIATIPASIVLSSDFTQENWDRDLALELCRSCRENAPNNGYCRLLTEGTDWKEEDEVAPPSTAPDSLRHWNTEQKKMLSSTPAGEALVDLEQRQEAAWRQKYETVRNEVSWPQFQWAMESVHSRAFCGVQTAVTLSNMLPPILAPILAAGIGYVYGTTTTAFPSEGVLVGLAFLGFLPTVLSIVKQEKASSAVMLPLIDSANHLETADSRIEYDPVRRRFELTVGPACLRNDDSSNAARQQLYISYGKKKDSELLLNYGFLPDVPMSDNEDEYRRNLAQAFHERNS